MQNITILGFDLGHGQTSVAKALTGKAIDIEPLELFKRQVWPSAILRRKKKNASDDDSTPDYDVHVGERAVKRLKQGDEFYIAFKSKPNDDPKYRQNMREFYFRILEEIAHEGIVTDWQNTKIYVGCPSGWSATDIQKYTQLLSEGTQFPAPIVQKESRAALLHAIEQGMELTLSDLTGAILVIDLGSSTLDFTIVYSGDTAEALEDFGDDLGAAIIDQFIYDYSIEHNSNASDLQKLLTYNPHQQLKLLYLCRLAKEAYFNDPEYYEDDRVTVGFEQLTPSLMFMPLVDADIMAEILNKPVSEAGYSWPKHFEAKVVDARDKILERKLKLRGIILTGGASRMDFVKQTVKDVFADFDDVKYPPDAAPEFSIARGLARWGRREHLIESFKIEIDNVFHHDVPPLVEKHLEALLDLLLPDLVDKVIVDFAVPEIFAWKKGEIAKIHELNTLIRDNIAIWLQSQDGVVFIAAIANQWWGSLLSDLRPILDPVCSQHEVPYGAFNLNFPFTIDDAFQPDIDVPIPLDMIMKIIGYVIFWSIVWVLPLGGPIIAALITLFFKEEIDDFIDEKMREIDIPVMMRKLISDAKINSVSEQQTPTICEKMKDNILFSTETREKLSKPLIEQLHNKFKERADEAATLIR